VMSFCDCLLALVPAPRCCVMLAAGEGWARLDGQLRCRNCCNWWWEDFRPCGHRLRLAHAPAAFRAAGLRIAQRSIAFPPLRRHPLSDGQATTAARQAVASDCLTLTR